jgi:shikimate dehydrogenase
MTLMGDPVVDPAARHERPPATHEPATHEPATQRTMHFIGVTTGQSSIMQVFPAWAAELGLDAVLHGIDFPPNDTAEHYRAAVRFIKHDELSLGALVTTHKINLYKACRDLFDGVGESTRILEEVSSISKRGRGELWGHAMDPVTSGLSLEALVPEGHWSSTGGQLLLLGAGGSSLALTLYLHDRARSARDVPAKVVVTNRSERRLQEMREVHRAIGFAVPIEYYLAESAPLNDAQLRRMPPFSVVINATGLGKDRPGSPLTDAAVFPEHAVAWDFNYRGDLVFLDQARAQQAARGLRVEDGWLYFIHGWTRVICEVLHVTIPTAGPLFLRLSQIAADAATGGR